MHKETLRSVEKTNKSSIMFVIALVCFLILVVATSNLLYNRWDIPYTGYVSYLLFALAGFYVYKYRIIDYQYTLIDDELIFERIVGKREKLITRVKLKDIVSLKPVTALQDDTVVDRSKNALVCKQSKKAYALIVRNKNGSQRIVFQPSSELVEMIVRRII